MEKQTNKNPNPWALNVLFDWTHLTKVNMESDKQFTVTTRSPQIQQSSMCGSIDAPVSGSYSNEHCSIV